MGDAPNKNYLAWYGERGELDFYQAGEVSRCKHGWLPLVMLRSPHKHGVALACQCRLPRTGVLNTRYCDCTTHQISLGIADHCERPYTHEQLRQAVAWLKLAGAL